MTVRRSRDRLPADALVDADAVLGRPRVQPDLGRRVPGPSGLRLGVVGDVDRDALGPEQSGALGRDAMEDRRRLAHHRDLDVDLAQGTFGVGATGEVLARAAKLGDEARVRHRDRRDLRERPEDLPVVLVVLVGPALYTAIVPMDRARPGSEPRAPSGCHARRTHPSRTGWWGKRGSATYSPVHNGRRSLIARPERPSWGWRRTARRRGGRARVARGRIEAQYETGPRVLGAGRCGSRRRPGGRRRTRRCAAGPPSGRRAPSAPPPAPAASVRLSTPPPEAAA